jgi:hypothetical protein
MHVKIDKAAQQIRTGRQGDQFPGLFPGIADAAVVRVARSVDRTDRTIGADIDQHVVENVDLSALRCVKPGSAERLVTQVQCYVPKYNRYFDGCL